MQVLDKRAEHEVNNGCGCSFGQPGELAFGWTGYSKLVVSGGIAHFFKNFVRTDKHCGWSPIARDDDAIVCVFIVTSRLGPTELFRGRTEDVGFDLVLYGFYVLNLA